MNRESNHERSRLCSCVGPNASKHLTGALGWPSADKWITSCENNKLYTKAEKIRALADEKESTYIQPSKILHTRWTRLQRKYKWGVCLCRCIWHCLCAQRSRQTYAPSHAVSPSGDSASPLSSRSVKQTWVIRHKWWQQRGIRQRCFQMQLPLNYREHNKGGDWRIERKNTGKPR